MKIIILIVTFFAFFFWFLMFMSSPMLLDGRTNSVPDWRILLALVAILFFPVLIGLVYILFGWTFLGLSPKIFLILCFLASITAATVMGYPRFFLLSLQGIPSSGPFVSEKGVFYDGLLIPGADSKTFAAVKDSTYEYFADKNHVYSDGKIVVGADPQTFHCSMPGALYSVYWLDHQHVYTSRGVVIPEADARTFQSLGEGNFGRDAKHVFHREKIIADADAASFQALDLGYFKDQRHVYYLDSQTGFRRLDGADAASFVVTSRNDHNPSDAKDKNRIYKDGNAL
jgi:hypothetical protein